MKRIVLHWTAGSNRVSALDRKHYHYIIDGDGQVIDGDFPVEANARPVPGKYAAHTKNFNTGAIGVSVAGMAGAVEHPFDPGNSPINANQIDALWRLCARLCTKYGIPVTRETVLTHAEVQPTMGVKQDGKWDITWLPSMDAPGAPVAVGDILRAGIREAMGLPALAPADPPRPNDWPTLRRGDRNPFVGAMQQMLADSGYFSGRIDNDFGRMTAAALLAFQHDAGLETDGIFGPATRRALEAAQPRPERDVSLADLRASGSQTIKGASAIDVTAGLAGVATAADMLSDVADKATGVLPTITMAVREHWPALIVLTAIGAVLLFSDRIKVARLRDAQTGANVKR